MRHDGGDAETGFGLDVGAGLAWSVPEHGVTVDLAGRGLLAHEDGGFEEWGVSGAVDYDPAPDTRRGISARVAPSWGATSSGGADALWSRQSMVGLDDVGETFAPGRRVEVEVGYGLAQLGGIGMPWVGAGLTGEDRDVRMGYRFVLERGRGSELELGVEVSRRERANGAETPDDAIRLNLSLRW